MSSMSPRRPTHPSICSSGTLSRRGVEGYLRTYRLGDRGLELSRPGFRAETIDVDRDRLGIREDVETLTAVMLAKDVTPPLAIGLFGDWGTGKSFFMKSMRAATDRLSKGDPEGKNFCREVVSIEFNAWHYADTNLWASLVSHILERLDAFVTPPGHRRAGAGAA
jgi:hypothetical protein